MPGRSWIRQLRLAANKSREELETQLLTHRGVSKPERPTQLRYHILGKADVTFSPVSAGSSARHRLRFVDLDRP